MATQAELTALAKELQAYKVKGTDNSQERLVRRNLYLNIFRMVFVPDDSPQSKQDFIDGHTFVNNILHHANLRSCETHLIVAEGLVNEVNRRKSLPQKGIKFPEFLHKKYVIDTLIKYCNYLMYGDKEIEEYLNKHSPGSLKAANDAAIQELKHDLSKLYMISYNK